MMRGSCAFAARYLGRVSLKPSGLPRFLSGATALATSPPLLVMAPAVPRPSFWVAFATSLSLKSYSGTSFLAGMFAAGIFDLVTLQDLRKRPEENRRLSGDLYYYAHMYSRGIVMRQSGDRPRHSRRFC
jgi:hypothetical protein